jgi:hypothetical protein
MNMENVNPEINKMEKTESNTTGDLDKAVERIYRKYGNDLDAFFREAKKSVSKKKSANPSEKSEPCLM